MSQMGQMSQRLIKKTDVQSTQKPVHFAKHTLDINVIDISQNLQLFRNL